MVEKRAYPSFPARSFTVVDGNINIVSTSYLYPTDLYISAPSQDTFVRATRCVIPQARHNTSAELHADLFSHHASPLEVYVFLAVDLRGEDVMSDEICRRCNGKQQRRRRDGRSVQLPD